jgi:predicted permease
MLADLWHLLGRIGSCFTHRRLDQDFTEELDSHVTMLTDENVRAGMSAEEARRQALIRIGGRTALQSEHRATRGLPLVETALQDLRFGVRQLWAHPGFATAAIGVLAVGIAANVAIFGFVDAALIRPLPFEQPSRLVTAFSTRPDRAPGQSRNLVSYLNFLEWRTRSRAFKSIAAFDVRPGLVLRTPQGAERVTGLRVTSDFFATLGVRPVLGREFRPDEEGPAAPATVMLAYDAWQTRFAGRADVLGQVLTIQGQPHVIIGVLPKDFYFPLADHADFWATIRGPQPCWESRGCRSLQAVGRLADGMSIEMARTVQDGLLRQLRLQYGDKNPETAALAPLTDEVFGDVQPILFALFGGVVLLLLIASVNVVSLLLARSDGRIREMAVRNAIGASSSRLVRQFAVESTILVGASTVLGLLLAHWAMQSLTGLLNADMVSRMPYLQGVGLNGRLFAWTAALAMVAIGLFTLAPMGRLAVARSVDALKESSRGSAGLSWQRIGRALIVGELAIATVLLVSAGLLAKSAYRLLNVNTGFNAEHLIVTAVGLGPARETPGTLALQVAERLRPLPGVEAVAYADLAPVGEGLAPTSGFQLPGRVSGDVVEDHPVRRVSASYFATLQATLLAGRFLTEDDVTSARGVVIINQTAARRYFPDEDPVGKPIVIGMPPARQIVGVVADIKDGPLETPPTPAAYVPFDQVGFSLLVRTSRNDAAVIPALNTTIREVRPNALIQPAMTMTERINRQPSATLKRASAWLISGFAVTALILSVMGLYGVMAYSVGQRSREIGVRMALGAARSSVYRLIVGESAWLVGAGTVVGSAGAILSAKLLSRLLFATQPWDVPTLVTSALTLIVCALIATFVPAHRAMTVNPLQALRAE